jgi:hypothetical protein
MKHSRTRYSRPAAKHSVFLYSTEDELISWLAAFASEGIESGEGVIAVASPGNLHALRSVLGRTPPSARFIPGDAWYARGPDTMGWWGSFIDDQLAAGRPGVRIINEVARFEDPSLHWELQRFEHAVTIMLEALATMAVCVYNVRSLPAAVIEAALQSHPGVIEHGSASLNSRHVGEQQLARQESLPSLGVPPGQELAHVERNDVAGVAAFVEAQARLAAVDEAAVQRLVAAASEIVLNSFVHARSPVGVATWREDDRFICQIEDEGPGIADPAIGYHRPYGGDDRWGVWLARAWSDGFELGNGHGGPAVRLTVQAS